MFRNMAEEWREGGEEVGIQRQGAPRPSDLGNCRQITPG